MYKSRSIIITNPTSFLVILRTNKCCGPEGGEKRKINTTGIYEEREGKEETSFSSQIVIGVHRPVSVVRIHWGRECRGIDVFVGPPLWFS
jgi:hypothetical protein